MPRRRPRPHHEPIRATSMWYVDQIFLFRRGQRIEVVSSLVNDDGGLRNLSLVAPTSDPREAVRLAAQFVAGKGNVYSARDARLRWAKAQMVTEQENLVRDYQLEDEYLDAFEETLAQVRDQMR